jgi:hypothetical protein
VVLLAALAGAAGFIVGDRTAGSEATTVTVATTQTETTTSTVSASDATGLPDEVLKTHAEILSAAQARDFDALHQIIQRSGEFRYTFGPDVPGGAVAYWKSLEQKGQKPLETLATILTLPYTLSRGIFVWPFAYDKTPDEITAYEQQLLNRIPDGAKTVGPEGYLGWRAGIRPDGRWVFYVAGD